MPMYVDTRQRYSSASQVTDITKRVAASGNLETRVAATACTTVLNAPSTRRESQRVHNGGHNVQDASDYLAYAAGQAMAQGFKPSNVKPAQILRPCYDTTVFPEYNDRLRTDTGLAAVQASKNQFARGYNTASCCIVCGKPPTFASGCNCRLTGAQIYALKSGQTLLHTIEPNVNVA